MNPDPPASAATPSPERTDWDRYYQKPFAATKFTRRFTENLLVGLMRRHASPSRGFHLVELGGANSCFFDRLSREFSPREYHIVDSNRFGLDRMAERLGQRDDVVYHQQDVLSLDLDMQADVVLSVGLIEHFDPPGTRRAIESHFALLRPGGLAIITFPTPTILYRACRGIAELARRWEFPDERPLKLPEVAATTRNHGEMLEHRINWPIMLTQMVIAVRKHDPAAT